MTVTVTSYVPLKCCRGFLGPSFLVQFVPKWWFWWLVMVETFKSCSPDTSNLSDEVFLQDQSFRCFWNQSNEIEGKNMKDKQGRCTKRKVWAPNLFVQAFTGISWRRNWWDRWQLSEIASWQAAASVWRWQELLNDRWQDHTRPRKQKTLSGVYFGTQLFCKIWKLWDDYYQLFCEM